MKIKKMTVAVSAIAALCLLGACSDADRDEALEAWEAFKIQETETIKATQCGFEAQDFSYRFVEVDDQPYHFKGFIAFMRGNVYQESVYAYEDETWGPVEYGSDKENRLEEMEEEYEELEERIEDLEEEVEDERDFIQKYRERAERLEKLQHELGALQSSAAMLKEEISRLEE